MTMHTMVIVRDFFGGIYMTENVTSASRVSFINMVINILLSILKIVSGVFGNSVALISDGIHSTTDILASSVIFIGIKLSEKSKSFEKIAIYILSVLIFFTGAYIGTNGIIDIVNKKYIYAESPLQITLYVSIFSIIVKILMFIFTERIAKKISSLPLHADAFHHKSDAFASAGPTIGIVFTKIGFPICDCIAGIVVSVFILETAISLFINNLKATD